jgi:hypothetical protein
MLITEIEAMYPGRRAAQLFRDIAHSRPEAAEM